MTPIVTYGSLFSGIGGLDLGVERATGARPAWFCESDPYCRAELRKHWPGVPIHDDVTALEHPEPVDLLCGGFPCQDVSQAGKRAGLVDGERSGLWREFARIIRQLRPRFVFVENVADLLVRGFDVVLGDLAACGGTMRSGRVFERQTLERPRKSDGASSSWPTPTTTDSKDAARSTTTTGIMHPGATLTDTVREFYHGHHALTPTMPPGSDGSSVVVVVPEFVEALMGLPRAWTLVDDDDACSILETP